MNDFCNIYRHFILLCILLVSRACFKKLYLVSSFARFKASKMEKAWIYCKSNADWLFIYSFNCVPFLEIQFLLYPPFNFRLSDDAIFFVVTDTSQINDIRYSSSYFSLVAKNRRKPLGASKYEEKYRLNVKFQVITKLWNRFSET